MLAKGSDEHDDNVYQVSKVSLPVLVIFQTFTTAQLSSLTDSKNLSLMRALTYLSVSRFAGWTGQPQKLP